MKTVDKAATGFRVGAGVVLVVVVLAVAAFLYDGKPLLIAIGRYLLGVGTCALGGAAIWTLYRGADEFQKRRFELEKYAAARAYRFSVAKRAISLFEEAKNAVYHLRREPIFGLHELKIELEKHESPLASKIKIETLSETAARVMLVSLRAPRHEELIKAITKIKPEFYATIGENDSFDKFFALIRLIGESAGKLCIYHMLDKSTLSDDEERKCHDVVCGKESDDWVDERINKIVKSVFDDCVPFLEVQENANLPDK